MITNNAGIDELKKKFPPFHSIILGVLVSIPCGFILASTITDTIIKRYHSLLIYLFCNIFFSLILGITISYGIKRKEYRNKRNLFILIVFCSFLIYFFFCIIFMYILFKTGYACSELLVLLEVDQASIITRIKFEFIQLFLWILCIWPLGHSNEIRQIIDYMCNSASMEQLLTMMVNMLFWVIQCCITIFFTWKYIIYTCPWLSEVSSSEKDQNCSTIKEDL